jgi:hypothetical protein
MTTETSSMPVAYRLYLPETWAKDRERRRKTGVPTEIAFQTKAEIGLAQIRRARERGRGGCSPQEEGEVVTQRFCTPSRWRCAAMLVLLQPDTIDIHPTGPLFSSFWNLVAPCRTASRKTTIGFFMAAFIYICLVFLVTHQDATSCFVLQVSLIMSWFLVVASFAFLVYYSHRIATSIQNPDMIARIADEIYPAVVGSHRRES